MGRRARYLAIVGWMAGAATAHAQLPAVGVPKGLFRIETDGVFEAFDERFRNGTRERYAADLSSDGLGRDLIPALLDIDTRISRITGASDTRLNLGRLSTDAHADISTLRLGLSFGLSKRITLFGRLPLSRTRTQSRYQLDATGADAGLIPDPASQGTFFGQFDAALATLSSKIDAGDYDANLTTKALAEATLADATLLHDDLFAVLGAPNLDAPFAPTASSTAGTAIATRVTTLQSTLTSTLGVTGFTTAPALPTAPIDAETFETFLENDLGFRSGQTELLFRGDAEIGTTFTLADRWNRGDTPGGFRAAVSALIRLPTGVQDRPDRPLDLGSGDGQMDVEVALVTDVGGTRWGARMTGMYTRQFAGDIIRRVSAPGEPFVVPGRLTRVRWNPGDAITIGVQPFFRLSGPLALQASASHWRRGADAASYSSTDDVIPGVDASVFAGPKASATQLGFGVTYANFGSLRPGGKGLPVEASWLFERVVHSGEGIVPAVQQVRGSLRLYIDFFN